VGGGEGDCYSSYERHEDRGGPTDGVVNTFLGRAASARGDWVGRGGGSRKNYPC